MSVYGGSSSAGFAGSRYGFGVLAKYVAGEGDCFVAFFGLGFGVDHYGYEGDAVACGGAVNGAVFEGLSRGARSDRVIYASGRDGGNPFADDVSRGV
jgi:hypothetical protein